MPSQTSQSHTGSKKGLQNSGQEKITSPLDFYRERGSFVIESETGWLNYYVFPTHAYLENLFIYPEKRRQQNSTYFLSILELELKEVRGVNSYITTISRHFGDPEKTLQICLKRGFKFHGSNEDGIVLKKEI